MSLTRKTFSLFPLLSKTNCDTISKSIFTHLQSDQFSSHSHLIQFNCANCLSWIHSRRKYIETRRTKGITNRYRNDIVDFRFHGGTLQDSALCSTSGKSIGVMVSMGCLESPGCYSNLSMQYPFILCITPGGGSKQHLPTLDHFPDILSPCILYLYTHMLFSGSNCSGCQLHVLNCLQRRIGSRQVEIMGIGGNNYSQRCEFVRGSSIPDFEVKLDLIGLGY